MPFFIQICKVFCWVMPVIKFCKLGLFLKLCQLIQFLYKKNDCLMARSPYFEGSSFQKFGIFRVDWQVLKCLSLHTCLNNIFFSVKKMPRRKSSKRKYILVTADEELVMDEPSLYRAKWRGREPIDVILRSINEDGLYVVTSPPGKKHKKTVSKHWTVKELFKEAKAEVWDTLWNF